MIGRFRDWFHWTAAPDYGLELADVAPQRLPEPCGHRPRRVRYVLSRQRRGLDIRLFEFGTSYAALLADTMHDADYSCVVARVQTGRGLVTIESRGVRRMYEAFPGKDPYMAFGMSPEHAESPRGRRFRRRGRFVAALLSFEGTDRPLHQWLTNLPGDWGFWIDDPWIFCYMTPQATTDDGIKNLLEMLEGFIVRLGEPPPQGVSEAEERPASEPT